MCFPYDAHPPVRPIAGAAVDHEDLVLQASGGARFAAFSAKAEQPAGPAVVVLPDVRGLFRFYEELALRFAEVGYDSVAIDYFGRTAGVSKRDAEFPFRDYLGQTKDAEIAADTRAAVEHLRNREGQADRAVFTVGFCFGGSNSWLQAAHGHGLAGVIGFYGMPKREWFSDSKPVIERVDEFECPVLGLMGGADQAIPPEDVQAFDDALRRAGVEHEIVTYEGAPHSFFDRTYEEHREASADAWQRMLNFIHAHS